ncbi:MAG TPA: M48 family metallopeptidase [Rhizomicrobium sp.]|jgi:STE24 endopeptidase|nr:M48 family metallopeptidase [Rhizomicrobium sp.]
MSKLSSLACAALIAFGLIAFGGAAVAQTGPAAAPTATVDIHSLPPTATASFDPDKATNAYLAQIKGEARQKSDSYFEGGYWLVLWDALYAIAVSALLLFLRISSRMRKIAEGMTRSRFLQAPIYIVQYLVITTVLTFPLSVYEGFIREHAYGLSNQNFVQWLGDFGTGFGVSLVAFTIVGTLVYAAIRGSRRYWWAWGTAITIVFFVIGATIAPVYIAPLFNHYQPLPEGHLKDRILSLARSEGIPADNVYEFDASRQSKRMSANVSGMFGTTRISMNDNLLNRGSEREIIAVLGHEMGHYVLDHSTRLILMMGLLFLAAFGFVAWGFNALAGLFGGIWDVRSVDDPAGLPALIALFSFFFLIATPIQNTIVRTTEAQADLFGVNAAREPDGFAKAALDLSEYRKLDPTPLEEFVFYDHPSGRNRIHMMMVWKKEHLNDPDIKAGPVSPQ